ncbi:MAG TPA: alpha-xylosidase [Phycisphaerales bacterium]|nr:alpha-xylosidase [Phycisphaerales bacterium]
MTDDVTFLNGVVDVSGEFTRLEPTYFLADRLERFDARAARGEVRWKRYARKGRLAFNQFAVLFEESKPWEFPAEYPAEPALPFSVDFITPRTVRLRVRTRAETPPDEPSLMLVGPPPADTSWAVEQQEGRTVYRSQAAGVRITADPWHFELLDARGRLLTRTQHMKDSRNLQNSEPLPFCFLRRASDLQRRIAASFSLSPDEKLFGAGESFTRLNKRGQKIALWMQDPHGVQTSRMYKPVPFFLSSRGYGMFVHTAAPLTFDFGCSYDGLNTIYCGDETLDVFLFVGTPKEILSEYTALTGRSPVPPTWSFGLWMSRLTYKSDEEVRQVTGELRRRKIPCDVIHLDTGWFETEWRCDYRFSPTRFPRPGKLMADLKEQGFRVSVWQVPYFTPSNPLYAEAVREGYIVRAGGGQPATEDATIDFSNPRAVRWYQGLLEGVLREGVSCIKADFGEGAPLGGQYASGKSGFYEHNLYPLRYNQAVWDVTRRVTGEAILWGRSAWAGCQRFPVHWGGDAETTDCAMAATLRAGLSLGLCGFSFWSHDIGGFVKRTSEELYRELYRRWVPFGMLTSHSRCHGFPPKEPWHYGEEFTDEFRRAVEMKYRLMPYILAQAKQCSERGHPMVRPLFFEHPDDPTSWLIEDEYLFGRDLLVAPLMDEGARGRDVYLPPGPWRDYQTGKAYDGARWHAIDASAVPVVVLARDGATIRECPVAQSTVWIDWDG